MLPFAHDLLNVTGAVEGIMLVLVCFPISSRALA